MEILFLHGMASSHDCSIALDMQKHMPESKVWAPDLSIDPDKAMPQIEEFLASHNIDVIVGHSLGGFMAQKLRGRKKILLNPSLGMSYMYLFVGDNKYKGQRYDGNQIWHVEKSMCRRYKEMQRTQYDNLTPEEDRLTIGLFGKWDFMTRMAAHWFKQHYTDRRFIPGTHYPSEATVRDYVVPVIKELAAR